MAVNLHTTHYRFGIDELAENTHGWHAAEDTNPAQGAIAEDTTFLLRFTLQETGGTAASNTDMQFQCALNGGAFQNITTTSTIVKAVAAVPLTNGSACTKRLSGTGTFESSGAGQTEDGLSGGAANDIAASGNSETECGLQIVGADTAPGDVITFRLTSPDFTVTNDVVPTITLAAGPQTFPQSMSAVGVGVATLAAKATFRRALAAAGVGTATLGTKSTFKRALPAVAVGVATLTTKSTFKRTLAVAAVGVASLATKLVLKVTLAAAAVGSASLSTKLVFKISLAAAAVGAAALATKKTFKVALAAVGIGIASLATEFIEYVGGAAKRLGHWIANQIGIGL